MSRILRQLLASTWSVLSIALPTAHAETYPFRNPDLPADERIDNLLSLMTLEEKIQSLGRGSGVRRLGIQPCGHVEGLHGLAMGGPSNWGRRWPVPTTQFPQAIGMAETWDPDVIRQAGAVEGYEARYIYQSDQYTATAPWGRFHLGGLVIRAPNADLGRDPRWGRTEECYGEDPYLAGTLAVAMIRGLQGDDPKYWQTASLMKHFFANSNEDGRSHTTSDFDDRLFHEYYSVPFRMGVVEGGSRAYMAAYNAHNGIPCTVHPVLREVTMNQWGLDGIICTDGGALSQLVTDHKYFPDLKTAAAASIKAGITYFLDDYVEAVQQAVDEGLLTEAEIDTAARGNFRLMLRLGLFDPPADVPYSRIGRDGEPEPWNSAEHRAVARLVAQKSIVLLKNAPCEGGGPLLPLDREQIKSIAVIGPSATEVFWDWYSGTPPYAVSPLDGIREAVGSTVRVGFAANNTNGVAATLAKTSDVAIVCVGNHPTCNADWAQCPCASDGKEAIDRRAIDLEQERLIRDVYEANPKTIVALVSSFPFAINWTQENVPTIVHMAHNGQEMGHALADALFGDVNPAGRLVQTWPRSLDDLAPMMDYDVRHGRTYMYFDGEPLYPFGFGLSYTTFEYANLRASPESLATDGELDVVVDVTNTGDRAGEEVVQLYVRHLDSRVERPRQELRGFARVALAAGQTRPVTLTLPAHTLAHWDVEQQRFVAEPGKIELRVGGSSADVRLSQTVRITDR